MKNNWILAAAYISGMTFHICTHQIVWFPLPGHREYMQRWSSYQTPAMASSSDQNVLETSSRVKEFKTTIGRTGVHPKQRVTLSLSFRIQELKWVQSAFPEQRNRKTFWGNTPALEQMSPSLLPWSYQSWKKSPLLCWKTEKENHWWWQNVHLALQCLSLTVEGSKIPPQRLRGKVMSGLKCL